MPLTPEQKAARRNGIGGSDVASICGISPWKNAYDTWLVKTGRSEGDDIDGHDHIIFGHLLEPVIRAEFERRNNCEVFVSDKIYKHPLKEYLVANVDGEILTKLERNLGLEIKTASEYSAEEWGEENTDQIPSYYLTQVLHYINVMNWDGCYVAVLIGGNKYRQYFVKRDEDAIASLESACDQFWLNHVLMDEAPPRSNDQLKDAWQKTTGKKVTASPDETTAVEALKVVKDKITQLEEEKAHLESRLKETIADADELVDGEGKKLISWKFNKSSRKFSAEKCKAEAPDVYERCTVEVAGPRVFRIY